MHETVVCQYLTNEYPFNRNRYYIAETQHKLSKCPFCLDENIILVVDNMPEPTVWAECTNCGAQGPHEAIVFRKSLFDAAVDAWNER